MHKFKIIKIVFIPEINEPISLIVEASGRRLPVTKDRRSSVC